MITRVIENPDKKAMSDEVFDLMIIVSDRFKNRMTISEIYEKYPISFILKLLKHENKYQEKKAKEMAEHERKSRLNRANANTPLERPDYSAAEIFGMYG